MKKWFYDHSEWFSALTGAIASIAMYFIVKDRKIPMYIFGVTFFISILIIWRLLIKINDYKVQLLKPLKFNEIIKQSDCYYIDIIDNYNLLPARSYITLLITSNNFLEYVATAAVTDTQSPNRHKKAIIKHLSNNFSYSYLQKNNMCSKLVISTSIQQEYVDYLDNINV